MRAVDILIFTFLAFLFVITLVFANEVPKATGILSLYAFLMASLYALIRLHYTH
jgi:hypothetical protein